jgi:hypothetical protein
MLKPCLPLLLIFAATCGYIAEIQAQTKPKAHQQLAVGSVPASFPVNFALYTVGKRQYVAYYDSAHQMTLAVRHLNSKKWQYQKLDSKVGWDSHNYISITTDDDGYIHLVGNLHSSPLIYFRSAKPHDINSMQALHRMTGSEEDVTTYPEFMRSPNGDLIFHYRYGRSGSGYEVYNKYDHASGQWVRLIDKPLTDGQKKMNAYMQGPELGPDGYYHLIWVWRDTPDCSTNHTLSHARSKDLLNWESIRGEKVALPITINYRELYVDTTPIKGGLINIGIKIGFDSKGQLVIGYHKYDKDGNTQLFLSRFENNNWTSRQITQWDYRWDFKGMGTIVNEILIDSPKPSPVAGQLTFGYHHTKYGHGQISVDENTFEPLSSGPIFTNYPSELDNVTRPEANMVVNKVFDTGKAPKNKRYMLRWETLPPNRDQKPKGKLPMPSELQLIKY